MEGILLCRVVNASLGPELNCLEHRRKAEIFPQGRPSPSSPVMRLSLFSNSVLIPKAGKMPITSLPRASLTWLTSLRTRGPLDLWGGQHHWLWWASGAGDISPSSF